MASFFPILSTVIFLIVFPIFYAINLSFHFINFSQCFAMVLLDFSSVSNAYPNAPSTIPTVAPYKRFCSFLPWFFSVLLLHSGHTSKLQFFHCFSIVSRVLYAIMVPHRSLYSFHRFSSRFNQFSKRSTQIFHCFPFFFHCFMSKSLLFSIVFLTQIFPSFPIFSHCFMSYSLIFSIVFLIIFPSIAICPESTSEGGPGGNRYPTVTQLPPGT